jgi:hypothetical protein
MKTEFDAYRLLKSIFEERLSSYKTTLEEDQVLRKQDLPWNEMSCVRLRLKERKAIQY